MYIYPSSCIAVCMYTCMHVCITHELLIPINGRIIDINVTYMHILCKQHGYFCLRMLFDTYGTIMTVNVACMHRCKQHDVFCLRMLFDTRGPIMTVNVAYMHICKQHGFFCLCMLVDTCGPIRSVKVALTS